MLVCASDEEALFGMTSQFADFPSLKIQRSIVPDVNAETVLPEHTVSAEEIVAWFIPLPKVLFLIKTRLVLVKVSLLQVAPFLMMLV